MNFPPIIVEFLKTFWWFTPLVLSFGFLFLVHFFRSPQFKGYKGELFVRVTAWLHLSSTTYYSIHNVTLLTPDGTTQIDHIFISRFGIFVVETKNMKGWIFGEEHEKQWTQKFVNKSFAFQNPLRQNYKHVKTLETLLPVRPKTIHSVVVFVGDSTFKSPLPANVTHGKDYIKYIKSFQKKVLSNAQVHKARTTIQSNRLAPSRKTDRQHVRQLKKRFDPNTAKKCPQCGKAMVLRTAKKGVNTGKQFWGCSAYPECRMVQNINK
ncbi:MAG: nuclease [Candidatus Electrothrix sp. AU1_5]|nr:nuclease [Candidatus Electrothrix gigas]